MSKKRGRPKPYDPAAAMLKAAEDRAAARAKAADPRCWGVANDTLELPSGDGLQASVSPRREVFARRLDPFQTLHRAGSLTAAQHQAAERLFKDWCQSQGISTDDPRSLLDVRRSEARGLSDLVNCRMIDASSRFEAALAAVGPATGEVLRTLMTPLVMCGTVLIWRAEVARVTGEQHVHAQGAVVRRACEDLRCAYEAIDRGGRVRSTVQAA